MKTVLWLDWTERDKVIDMLLRLKKSYGDFIYNKSFELKLMKTASLKGILATCRASEVELSLDPMGNKKSPCHLGPDADCSRCGCTLPIWSFPVAQAPLAPGLRRGRLERDQGALNDDGETIATRDGSRGPRNS